MRDIIAQAHCEIATDMMGGADWDSTRRASHRHRIERREDQLSVKPARRRGKYVESVGGVWLHWINGKRSVKEALPQ
jgi:hypothetical protein